MYTNRLYLYRIPKALFYRELANGRRSQGGQYKRCKDVLKSNLKACEIPTDTWENQALNRTEWRTTCYAGVKYFERRRITELQERRTARKAQLQVHPPLADIFPCPECQRQCRSQIGLRSHRKSKHRAT